MALEFADVQGYVERFGPLAVGVGSTLDNTGVPVFYVAGMAVAFAAKAQASLGAMWVAALIGSVVGDLGTYAIGRYYLTKDHLLDSGIGRGLAPTIHAGERIMAKYGFLSLVFGRFIPYVGKILPLLAGSYRMSWAAATASVVAGSFLLTGFYYACGQAVIELVRDRSSAVRAVSLAVGLAVVAGLYYANSRLKARSERAPAAGDEPVEL